MPMLPKFNALLPASAGGLPPLAIGCGIGSGDFDGSVIRIASGLADGILDVCEANGTAWAGAGDGC